MDHTRHIFFKQLPNNDWLVVMPGGKEYTVDEHVVQATINPYKVGDRIFSLPVRKRDAQ